MSSPGAAKRKPKKSFGSDVVIEKEKLPVPGVSERALNKVHISTKRELIVRRRMQLSMTTRDAGEDPRDHRPVKDPTYDVFRKECDTGIQATTDTIAMDTQTPFHRKINVSCQAVPDVVDARLIKGESESMRPTMRMFFDKHLPRMMHHLTYNFQVPLFKDDFADLTEEDAFVGSREDNFLKEAGNFAHMHTKNKMVTCIDWRPGAKSIVAISIIHPIGLVERVELQRKVRSSVALVWNFADPMHPQFVLEAPNEVMCIRFNPTRPHLIVGGLMNGQVVMWDLSAAQDATKKTTVRTRNPQQHQEDPTSIPAMPQPIKGHLFEPDGDAVVSRLQPCQVSRVEGSHKRAVHDIHWLPDSLECGFDGKLFTAELTNQFVTISEDGAMCIWDLRPEHLPADKLRKMKHQGRGGSDDKLWVPMLRYPLTKLDGAGEVLGLRLHLEGKINNAPSYQVVCTTIEGELCICNWGPKDEKRAQQGFGNEDGGSKQSKLMRQLSQAHHGPAWTIHRHPQLPDYYLTVGDWGFKIWKVGLTTPVISSPSDERQMMCGRWSPTRASVVFIGTSDGFVQVWDLLDRSHEPVLTHPMTQDAITVVELKPVGERKGPVNSQLIAFGTRAGTFHLFELPKVLIRGHSNELRNMRLFLEREVRRVSYFAWRWKERQKEMDRHVQDRNDASAGGGGKKDEDDDKDEEENEFNIEADQEATFLEKVEALAEEGDKE